MGSLTNSEMVKTANASKQFGIVKTRAKRQDCRKETEWAIKWQMNSKYVKGK